MRHTGFPNERRHEDPESALRIDRSLDASVKEGVTAQMMIGIFDYFLVPYALFLGAASAEIGLLTAAPLLVSSLAQLFLTQGAVHFFGGRRRLLVRGVAIQAAVVLPIAFLAWSDFPGRFAFLLAAVTLHRSIGALLGPAWGSLMSDHLPEERRGLYFGRRSRVVGVAGMIGMIVWGSLLSGFGRKTAEAFFLLFFAAAAFRFASVHYMTRMADIPLRESKADEFTFWMFVRRVRESNFVRFVLYVAAITFAVQLSAAYFSVYMLRDRGVPYAQYTLVHLAGMVSALVSFPVWGRHADLVGNARVMKTTSYALPLIPLAWAFAANPYQMMAIEAFAGFVWGGFNLCATNFVFDAVSPSKRMRCLVYVNLLNGAAAFAGASLGGAFADRLPVLIGGSSLPTLFLISALGRALANLFMRHTFEEVRASARKTSSPELFLSVLGLRPMLGRDVDWPVFPFLRPFAARRARRRATGG